MIAINHFSTSSPPSPQSTGVSAGEEVLVQSSEKTELHLIEMDELEINPRFVVYLKRVTIPVQGYSKEQLQNLLKDLVDTIRAGGTEDDAIDYFISKHQNNTL